MGGGEDCVARGTGVLEGDSSERGFVGGGNCLGEYQNGARVSYIVDGENSYLVRR